MPPASSSRSRPAPRRRALVPAAGAAAGLLVAYDRRVSAASCRSTVRTGAGWGGEYPRALHPGFIGPHADLATTDATAKVFHRNVPTWPDC